MLEVLGMTLSVVLGGAATICSSMVLFNLRSMSRRIDKVETAQAAMCRDYVDKVDYIRSITSLEGKMDKQIEATSEMTGSMKVMIEQMPQICGSIAREIVKEMKP
ncbi:MAG: hypothetical protein JRE40_09565 [Deltaproteobacteria bacterium]|nr:hypothetical protein [Deltaproteobacteria bacterium]